MLKSSSHVDYQTIWVIFKNPNLPSPISGPVPQPVYSNTTNNHNEKLKATLARDTQLLQDTFKGNLLEGFMVTVFNPGASITMSTKDMPRHVN
jgi:hypothetical protein